MTSLYAKYFPVLFSQLFCFTFFSFGQDSKVPKPSLPGYSGFHSNLGIQEIVEVGVPLSRKRAVLPSASPEKKNEVINAVAPSTGRSSALSPPSNVAPEENRRDSFSVTPQVGLRAYRTSNVLRAESGAEQGSRVFESNIGVGISRPAMELSPYVTLIPRLDLMMQWANYGKYSELLDYRFGLVKGGLVFGFSNGWSAGVTLDYNVLHNQKTGDRTFDSWSPAISLQKTHSLSDSSFVIADIMLRQSSTEQTVTFPAAGVFADSGDNRQYTASLTYIKQLGENGKWTFMPRISYTLTEYLNSPSTGRDDRLFSIGASLIYQWTDWLSAQTFLTNSSMSSDSIPSFSATDFGLSLSASHQF
ncbi:MAG: hypothetical protein P8N49_08845 [Opitutales bacterium]|nr:hypothetical protein [Opitutales bacterium]